MAKFEIEMELTGFKMKIRAERPEDVPHITGQISKQLSGFVQPPGAMIEEPKSKAVESTVRDAGTEPNRSRVNGRPRGTRRKQAGSAEAPVITWTHDPGKWGMPKQAWTLRQKIVWVLYVISKEAGKTAMTGPAIVEAFNNQFRQFGPLSKQNMPRDLGELKKKVPAQVMDDTTQTPSTWYLTDEGMKEAEKLVIEARGLAPAAEGTA